MKRVYSVALMAMMACNFAQAHNPEIFNEGWVFTESDSKDYSLTTYNTKDWESVVIPHDFSIAHPFSADLEGCTGFMPGGIGWYAKEFKTEINNNQKCYIIFDGVYNNAEFWLNGMRVGEHPFGYAPIYYDITDYLNVEGEVNKFMVRVDHSRYADSRWYTGSGIYRDVKIMVTDKLHIPVWGTYLTTPKVSKKSAEISLELSLENDYKNAKKAVINTEIIDKNGKIVATKSTKVSMDGNTAKKINQSLKVKNPELWGIDSPTLYTAKSVVSVDGKEVDCRDTRFGIRTIRFDADKGFFLNGENMKIKGVCLHHDAGIVGAAVPRDVWKRRLQLLKDMGCNAIRGSHNPVSDEFLELCDEMGMLVQNEFYDEWDIPKDKRYNMHEREVDYITRGHAEHFQEWKEIDLKNTMLSSRNHPSVFQWSIGNEIEWTYKGNPAASGIFKDVDIDQKMDWTLWRTEEPPHTPQQVRDFWANYPEQPFTIGERARELAAWTREMDTTRPVTANCILPTSSFETGYTDALDVVGYSYKPQKYDYFKATYPDKCMMGTENVVRWYEWKACEERDFIPGIFLWTGFDYMGEQRAENYPCKVTECAPMDLAGFARGSFYQFKSFWSDEPVLAIYTQNTKKSTFKVDENGVVVEKKKDGWKLAPRPWQKVNSHWNYADGEGVIVEVYSNCPEVELFCNGESLGVQKLEEQEDRIYKWYTEYADGKIEARGTFNGEDVVTVMETVGEPTAIELVADRCEMDANNQDMVHVIAQLVDSKGRKVCNVEDDITFEISGAHRFLGTDCGNSALMESFKNHTCPTFNGKNLLMVGASDKGGEITIKAVSAKYKLPSNNIIVKVK